MIRLFRKEDITPVMKIWLDSNINAHNFIAKEYWTKHYAEVKELLPQAEVYVYEEDETHQIVGFIGLVNEYIAGIFVTGAAQSKGIGKKLLDYVKEVKADLTLDVYQKNERALSFYQREHFRIQSITNDENTNEKEYQLNWSK